MNREHEDILRRLALNEESAVESMLGTTLGELGRSALDAKTYALIRLAGLIAVESAPASYQWSVATALAAGATDDEIIGVIETLAPIVGLARVSSAASDLALAIGYDLDLPGRL